MTGQEYALIITAFCTGIAGIITATKANNKANVNAANLDSLAKTTDNHETRLTSQDEQLTAVGLAVQAQPSASVSTSGPVVVENGQGGTSI